VDDKARGLGPRGIAYGVGTLLILLLGWFFVHSRSAGSKDAASEVVPAPVAQENAPAPATAGTNAVPSVSTVSAKASAAAGQTAPGDSYGRWRVIAFTYSQEEQARQKAACDCTGTS